MYLAWQPELWNFSYLHNLWVKLVQALKPVTYLTSHKVTKVPFKIPRHCSTHWQCLLRKRGGALLVTIISCKFLAHKYNSMAQWKKHHEDQRKMVNLMLLTSANQHCCQWRHQGGHGAFPPPSEALLPHLPPPHQKKKMTKINHFRQISGFLPPQTSILPPQCPPQKKKKFLVPPLTAV